MAPVSMDPNVWFLGSREYPKPITYTSNNLVEPLIDGQSYMTTLYFLLIQTGQNDYIHYAGWQLNLNLNLMLDDPQTQVSQVFLKSQAKGAKVRVMLSDHIFPPSSHEA